MVRLRLAVLQSGEIISFPQKVIRQTAVSGDQCETLSPRPFSLIMGGMPKEGNVWSVSKMIPHLTKIIRSGIAFVTQKWDRFLWKIVLQAERNGNFIAA